MYTKHLENSLTIWLVYLVKFKNQIIILKKWLVMAVHTGYSFLEDSFKIVKNLVEPVEIWRERVCRRELFCVY
jgi:hypothetical protein